MEQIQLTSNESIGRENLMSFLETLILNFKSKKISSESLMKLTKAYYLLDCYKKLEYEGYIRLETNERDENGDLQSYVFRIYSDEVILCYEGYVHGPFGGDSEYEEMYNFDDDDEFDDPVEKISNWVDSFNSSYQSVGSFSIEDATEDIEEIIFDDTDEED